VALPLKQKEIKKIICLLSFSHFSSFFLLPFTSQFLSFSFSRPNRIKEGESMRLRENPDRGRCRERLRKRESETEKEKTRRTREEPRRI
jgi:hypothetical protein